MKNEHPSNNRRKLTPLKIALYAVFAIGTIALVCALTILFFPDPLVNRFIKPRITKAFADEYPCILDTHRRHEL